MTEALRQHQQLCDEIHACVLDENRFLRQHGRSPDEPLVQRKRELLQRLDTSLAALRAIPATVRNPAERDVLERARGRILQILQLDRENEQLLLRASLGGGRASALTHPRSAAILQKIYSRCA